MNGKEMEFHHHGGTEVILKRTSDIFEEPFYIVMVSGKNKFYKIALPSKENSCLDAFPQLPEITSQALESEALMDLPVPRKYVDKLSGRFFDIRFFRWGK